jgi:hypothetical protein
MGECVLNVRSKSRRLSQRAMKKHSTNDNIDLMAASLLDYLHKGGGREISEVVKQYFQAQIMSPRGKMPPRPNLEWDPLKHRWVRRRGSASHHS